MNIITFSENVKHLRGLEHSSQSEIGGSIGFSLQKWNNYERSISYPKLEDLEKISNYFGVLESDLLHTELAESDLMAVYDRFIQARNASTPRSKSFISYVTNKKLSVAGIQKGLKDQPKDHLTDQPTAKKGQIKASYNNQLTHKLSPDYGAKTPSIVTVNERGIDNIVYVPVKAQAGYLLGHGDPEFVSELPSFRMPGLNNATYRMFEVEGLSMSPTLSDRDRVIARWVPSVSEIRENRVHVVVLKDGVLIKRVLNRADQRGKIYLKSDTLTHRQDYPIMEVEPQDILEIWYVNMKVSSDLSEPAELYNRMSELEINQLQIMKKLGISPSS